MYNYTYSMYNYIFMFYVKRNNSFKKFSMYDKLENYIF